MAPRCHDTARTVTGRDHRYGHLRGMLPGNWARADRWTHVPEAREDVTASAAAASRGSFGRARLLRRRTSTLFGGMTEPDTSPRFGEATSEHRSVALPSGGSSRQVPVLEERLARDRHDAAGATALSPRRGSPPSGGAHHDDGRERWSVMAPSSEGDHAPGGSLRGIQDAPFGE
jgi:hypothetical protein